jgi:hypothetical protein
VFAISRSGRSIVSPPANAWSGNQVFPSESLNDEKYPALIRTGGACAAEVFAEAEGTAETDGVTGTEGADGVAGAAGATGALGAAGAEAVAAAAGFSLADSQPTNNRIASANGKVNDSCLTNLEIRIRFILIRFITLKLLPLSLQQQVGFHGLF